ncbi:hypothetical protein LCGC14_1918170 [marine sediment metagenome]|uniref:Uncharacterized protein n=1 Tax=marine sediment metagenome TaxID=412755 RepID=A0A0F9FSB5_9ZZZZ
MSSKKLPIDNFFFDMDKLANDIIGLCESKRGNQAKLVKSIGKKSSLFSDIKRGKRVNAYHIVAIGRVFGIDKVAELLDIDNQKDDMLSHSKKDIENLWKEIEDLKAAVHGPKLKKTANRD